MKLLVILLIYKAQIINNEVKQKRTSVQIFRLLKMRGKKLFPNLDFEFFTFFNSIF